MRDMAQEFTTADLGPYGSTHAACLRRRSRRRCRFSSRVDPARTPPSGAIPVRTALAGRAARRPALRVHAAGRAAGGLSRASRRQSKRRPPKLEHAGPRRRLSPPPDPRLNVIKVTPDPGVIEVNVHPAASWREAVDITRDLYEEARLSRLGTDKFMIDGRHTGTGGGNHVVLGGATAAGQPVPAPARSAEEPDALLAAASVAVLSVLRPVHRPDQPGAAHRRGAPRSALRTRDRAFEGAAAGRRRAAARRGWSTGCSAISWSTSPATPIAPKSASTSCSRPDGPTGRLGLVEFRSFEMPPDARMSLAQQLLLRALVAWFWREPQHGSLVRWGTALHDRFMLEHFVWEDFLERARGSAPRRLRLRSGLVRRAARIPFSASTARSSTAA